MRIAYCIHGLFNSGGMERMISAKANWLAEHGHEVTIITTEQNGKDNFFHLNSNVKVYDLGIGYTYIEGKSTLDTMKTFLIKKARHLKILRDYLNNYPQDIVISTFGNEVDLLPKINDRSKKIAEIHFSNGYRKMEHRKGIWKFISSVRSIQDNHIIRKYDRFVVLTQEDKKCWVNSSNISVIPNFTERTDTTSPLQEKRAIAVGRLTHQKGFDMLIDIWAKVNQKNPNWHLEIFGNGEDRDMLQKTIDNNGLSCSVRLNPNSKDIKKEYLKSSIYLMTSRYEGMPMTLTEAMNFGLIPISFACKCGPRDLIEDQKSGYLIENQDITKMTETLLEVIDDIENRRQIGQNAHQRIDKFYTPEVVMQQWMKLFKDLIKEK